VGHVTVRTSEWGIEDGFAVINYRLGVVAGVLAFFEAELDHFDGVVDVAAEDAVTRGMVRIGGEAGDMGLGLVDGEEGRLGQVLALGVLIGSRVGYLEFVEWQVEPCVHSDGVRVDSELVSNVPCTILRCHACNIAELTARVPIVPCPFRIDSQ
jgi:hypothetical protein